MPDPYWRDHAACAQTDPELFFADKDNRTTAQAKSICRTCPVTNECLQDSIRTGDQFSVRAGLTPKQRRGMHQRPPGQCRKGHNLADVGVTPAGYCNQCRQDTLQRHYRKKRQSA